MSVTRGTITEGSGSTLSARIRSYDGDYLEQADVSAITYIVIDQYTGSTITSGSLTVASVIFDTLQTDVGWTDEIDSTGYNFRYDSPKTWYPEGGRTYHVEVIFDLVSGEDVSHLFKVTTIPVST